MSFLSAQGALSSSLLIDCQCAESILLTCQLDLRNFVMDTVNLRAWMLYYLYSCAVVFFQLIALTGLAPIDLYIEFFWNQHHWWN